MHVYQRGTLEEKDVMGLVYFTWACMFETASSEVSHHLFSVTHLPKAQIPRKYELMLKWTLLHPLSSASSLPTCTRTHTGHAGMCGYTHARHSYTKAHMQPACGSECCSCMSSGVELCGEDLWSQPGSQPASPLFAFSLLGLLASWPLTSFRCRLQR